MVLSFLFSLFLSPALAQDETAPIRIAVIDTGFGKTPTSRQTKNLCAYGHKDFTTSQQFLTNMGTVDPVPLDNHDHGTNIVGVIDRYASLGKQPYCFIILKYFNRENPAENIKASLEALKYALFLGVDVINYSGGGEQESKEESLAVKQFLDTGGVFIAAAGNERSDLAKKHYYPAESDSRVIVVGALDEEGNKAKYGNYGERVDWWEIGSQIAGFGLHMSGTSQATAVVTGKIIASKRNLLIKTIKQNKPKKTVAIKK